MIVISNILMLFLLFYVFYEDVKERKVTQLLFIFLFVIGGFLNVRQQIFEAFIINTSINITMVFLIVLILFLYSKFKMNIELFQGFGLGDLLFFLFMAISFPTLSFLVLFSTSLIFSFIVSITFQKKLKELVPLAGLQALFLGFIVGVNQIFSITNLYAF